MELTENDIKRLIQIGYTESDIEWIRKDLSNDHYTYELYRTDNGKKVKDLTAENAIRWVGRKHFVSGIGRACFHHTAVREGKNGRYVLFECHNF